MGIFFPILRFSLYLCTMKLHIFNPEHDLALAANLKQFTAPHAVDNLEVILLSFRLFGRKRATSYLWMILILRRTGCAILELN